VIHKFLVNLDRQRPELLSGIDKDLVERYLPKKALSCFSMVKPSESEKTLSSMSKDLYALIERFNGNAAVAGMSSYKLLRRVLDEQCLVSEATDGELVEVSVKPAKEVRSDSLQNPSDPDATYDGHKGQGYQVQVMETYHKGAEKTLLPPAADAASTTDVDASATTAAESSAAMSSNGADTDIATTADAASTTDVAASVATAAESSTRTLNLITHIKVERACESDAHALIPAIEATQERGLGPQKVLADSLYGGDENCTAAKAKGVDVVSPVMGTGPKAGTLSLTDFTYSADGKVVLCPQGHAPKKTKEKGGRHTAVFQASVCNGCPRQKDCPARKGTRHYYLHYDDKTLRIAQRRAHEQTPEFKEDYRMRSGVEGTMSQYDRCTGVKQLRVRGFTAVKLDIAATREEADRRFQKIS
jgi:hypothetical protein